MKLSIIIPVYNGSRYMEELFACLSLQTCRDYEAIFINDGSNDNILEIFEQLQKKYPFVRACLYSKKNGGVSSARNLGIEKATGDVLAFCDVDDQIPSYYVDYILKTLQRTNVDMVYWKFRYCKEEDQSNAQIRPLRFSVVERKKVLEEYLYKTLALSNGSCAVKTGVVRQHGLRYDESAKYSEDLNFIWKILLSSRSVGCIDNVLYFYIMQPNSAMRRFDEARIDGYRIAIELTDFAYKMSPEFAPLYEQYEGPRLLWSMAWQGAQSLERKSFFAFFEKLPIREAMQKLCSFPRRVTRFSARLYLVSPKLFRLIARGYGYLSKWI